MSLTSTFVVYITLQQWVNFSVVIQLKLKGKVGFALSKFLGFYVIPCELYCYEKLKGSCGILWMPSCQFGYLKEIEKALICWMRKEARHAVC